MVALSAMLTPAAFAQESESTLDYDVFESIEKVDNGNGTWSKPDTGRTVGEVEWRDTKHGAVMWQYEGMAEYSYTPDPYSEEEFTEPSEEVEQPKTRAEKLLGAVKVKGSGERWVAIDVVFDETPADAEPDPTDDDGSSDLEYGTWEPSAGWDDEHCPDGKSSDDIVTWFEDDDQSAFTSLSADRHYWIVWFRFTFDGTNNRGCSGIMTGSGEILTAAHCIQDHNGDMATILSVCSRGNSYSGADCMTSPPGGYDILTNYGWWSGSKNEAVNTENDYALIQYATNGSQDTTQLVGNGSSSGYPLTTHTDSQIVAQTLRRYGYDHYHYPGSCDYQRDTTPYDSMVSYGWLLTNTLENDGTNDWIEDGLIKSTLDSGDGGSGGPYFICYNDSTCASPELVGVQSGHYHPFLGTAYSGGPNANDGFADFVDLN
jgi:V8-like Glu-specific endopeptidase